jgi:hypothetical protein
MLACSVRADLARVKAESTERALHLKIVTKTADPNVTGSYDFAYKYNK